MAMNVATPTPGQAPASSAPPSTPQRTQLIAYLYLAPVIIATILFTIGPFIYNAYLSFTNYSLFRFFDYEFVGLRNYQRAIAIGNEFFPVLGWTTIFMLASTILNVGTGALLAMALNHPGLRERNLYRTLLIIPWALPGILLTQVWRGIFNSQGPLNLLMSYVGIDRINWLGEVSPARFALVGVNLWFSYPFFMLVSLAALQAIPRDLYEVADLDGAGRWQRFRAITWPFMLAAITPLIITQLAFQFNNAGLIILFTEGNPLAFPGATYGATDTLASYAYKLVYTLRDYGYAAAYGIIIFAVVAAFTAFNAWWTGSFKEVD
jgi:arabinogalactan oligomer / maltooligosaccharide transport system permease protein